MNALEQLREDVKEELDDFDAWSARQEGVLAILDRFISKYEAVPAAHYPADNSIRETWYRCTGAGELTGEFHTILVPRTQEPTLLEVVKKHKRAADALYTIATVPESTSLDYMAASQALATAISKEQSE